jgi:hypothetical protein
MDITVTIPYGEYQRLLDIEKTSKSVQSNSVIMFSQPMLEVFALTARQQIGLTGIGNPATDLVRIIWQQLEHHPEFQHLFPK